MGWIERWNSFAKKKLYINETVEIPMGRLVYTGLVTIVEGIIILVSTGSGIGFLALLLNFLLSWKKRVKEEDSD